MKPRKTFAAAYKESLIMETPYWAVLGAIAIICAVIDSMYLNLIVCIVALNTAFGAWVVFSRLKVESAQDKSKFDIRGALRNMYNANWWAWYVFRNKQAKK